jgi:3-hydroxyisobutyrate dehydrogenase
MNPPCCSLRMQALPVSDFDSREGRKGLSIDKDATHPNDRRGEKMIEKIRNKTNTKIGVIGLGLMGSGFLRRLNGEGWHVEGWNRSRAVTLPLREYGFAIEDTLASLVRTSEVLISSLANDDAVRAVYFGEDGVFENARPGTTILEMSTISPDLSAQLHQEARKRGTEMMDLPVSGSTPAVNAGTVTLFAGGEPATFDRCILIFESIARQSYLMGPATAGVRMKLVANLLLGVNMEAIAEAISLGEHLQLNRDLLLEVLPKTAVIAPAFLGKFKKIQAGDYSPQFPLYLMSKDLNLVGNAADESGAILPATSATKHIFEEALAGKGELDLSAVTTYVQTLAPGENPIG